ncbi:MAG: RICIN domain-containing protein [Candidatus Saccharibacteria bacterium]|nr:RICIN domain-containing protein [Candidatus Saccharibacteria bacterium]
MKHKLIRLSSVLAGLAFVAVFYGLAFNNTPSTTAITAMDFKAGNIIDDAVFYNAGTMTVEEIQAHLNRYMPACDTWGTGAVGSGRYINGVAVPSNTTRAEYARRMRAAGNARYHEPPYVCVQNYYENPATHETLYETKNVIKDGMISAAQIIYNASQKYGINPQVLLVLLKKESYVWGDNWPLKDEYNTVMGYACPDTAPCDSKYFGFYNQVEMAAWQLNYYKSHIYSYNYRPYATNSILYSPTTSCGRKSVYLENIATTSLYIYTPYTPNDAALRNYPGTATCGSYGNRNFFMYFSEWFGDTHSLNIEKKNIPELNYSLTNADGTKNIFVENNSKDEAAKLTAGQNNASSVFSFKQNSDGSYAITNLNSQKQLAITDSVVMMGSAVKQSTSSTANKWYIYSKVNGEFYIASASNPAYVISITDDNQVVLDIYGSANSKPLKLIPAKNEALLDGQYTISSKLRDNFALTVLNSNIVVSNGNDSDAQKYTITYDQNSNYYTIKNTNGKYVSLESETVTNGVNVMVSDAKNSCTQKFLIAKKENSYSINSACDISYSFDVARASTDNGTNVIAYTFSSSKINHEWWFDKIETKEETPVVTPTVPEKTEPETKQVIADGKYVIRSALRANYALDVLKAELYSGANVNTWNSNGSIAQVFNFKYDSSKDAYLITNSVSGHALDMAGGKATNGTNVQIYNVNNTCSQYWKIIKKANGNYSIITSCDTNYALDVAMASADNGTNIIVYTYNSSKTNQEWWFEKVDVKEENPTVPEKTEPQTKQLIEDGKYVIRSALRSNYALDVLKAALYSGANVNTWNSNGSIAQVFNFKYNSAKDAYLITSATSGHALDMAGGKAKNGANVQIYNQNNTCSQYWKIEKKSNGKYSIHTSCDTDYALDVAMASADNGTNIIVYTYNSSKINQEWWFEKK